MSDADALCRRIAAALDISLEELQAVQTVRGRAAELQEAADLLRAFRRLPDREARRRCIGYVEAEVTRARNISSEAV